MCCEGGQPGSIWLFQPNISYVLVETQLWTLSRLIAAAQSPVTMSQSHCHIVTTCHTVTARASCWPATSQQPNHHHHQLCFNEITNCAVESYRYHSQGQMFALLAQYNKLVSVLTGALSLPKSSSFRAFVLTHSVSGLGWDLNLKPTPGAWPYGTGKRHLGFQARSSRSFFFWQNRLMLCRSRDF